MTWFRTQGFTRQLKYLFFMNIILAYSGFKKHTFVLKSSYSQICILLSLNLVWWILSTKHHVSIWKGKGEEADSDWDHTPSVLSMGCLTLSSQPSQGSAWPKEKTGDSAHVTFPAWLEVAPVSLQSPQASLHLTCWSMSSLLIEARTYAQ